MGDDALSVITLEEYNSMTGIHIIPKTIESLYDYMFASNIRNDNPIYDIKGIDEVTEKIIGQIRKEKTKIEKARHEGTKKEYIEDEEE